MLYNKLKEHNFPHTYIEINKFDSVYSYLKDLKCPRLEPFTTSTGNKNKMIENLMTKFQTGDIRLPADDYYVSEFESFNYDYDAKTRNVSFGAPEGLHDDCVMSCALAFYKMKMAPSFSWAGKAKGISKAFGL